MHVPDPGEHGVSYLGRCSNLSRGTRRRLGAARGTPEVAPPTSPSRKAFRAAWAQLLKKVWKVDVSRCPRCGGATRIISAVLLQHAISRILDQLRMARPRPPNPHDCAPLPGKQLALPDSRHPHPGPLPPAEDERDPRLADEWPVDPPFMDDVAS